MGGVDGSTAGYVALTAAALMEIMETASVGAAARSLHTRTAMTVTDRVSEDGSVDASVDGPSRGHGGVADGVAGMQFGGAGVRPVGLSRLGLS